MCIPKKIVKFLAVTFILPLTMLFAQQDSSTVAVKDLTISAGYLNFGSVDELYSYSRYSGQTIVPRIRIEGFDEGAKEVTDIKLALINRYPSVELPDDIMYYNRLQYISSFIYEQNETYNYPAPPNNNENSTLYYAINWYTYVNISLNGGSMPELLLSSIGPGVTYSFEYKKHTFYASVSTGLVSYSCRNNYGAGIVQDYESFSFMKFVAANSRIQSALSLQTVLANINYQYDINGKVYLEFNYDFRYIHDTKPRELTSASGNYSLGVGVRLK